MNFTHSLLAWHKNYARDLPWKHTTDPYKIWLSEIILQQTRVEQGMPYYFRFIEKFPTVYQLASASEDEVLKCWQGLGYYSRARNLHHAAQQIVDEYGGKLPNTYAGLLKLKGVGAYTAAAIASFAFKEPVAAVDGNAYRVLSRFFGIETPIDTTEGKKQFASLTQELIPHKAPDVFNQALMDFGSLVCVPQKPLCAECPLQAACMACAKGLAELLPAKSKRTAVRPRYFHYLLIRKGKYTYLRKRDKKDIWQGLYEFPLIETANPVEAPALFANEEWKSLTGNAKMETLYRSPVTKHQLSHQTIWAVFYVLKVKTATTALMAAYEQISVDKVGEYAFPQLIERVLHTPEMAIFFV